MKTISKQSLTTDVANGLKLEDLCTKYDLNKSQMRTCLKEAGLKIKKTRAKAFTLVDDLIPVMSPTETLN